MKKWEELPEDMQTEEVRHYYDILRQHRSELFLKRVFDLVAAAMLLVVLSPLFLALSAAIKLDSSGPVFYRQERVTQYGRRFRIHKFRSMVTGADRRGSLITVKGDARITRVGKVIRRLRLDEIPQLLDVLLGNMTFVGMRAEVVKYVERYTPEMMATLLLPAGVTSEACIRYKDEAELLDGAEDNDTVYVEQVLPGKMYYGLQALENYSFRNDIVTMLRTVLAVLGKEYHGELPTTVSAAVETRQAETVK